MSVLNSQRSVLIVDRSEETREVLQTVLERRGVRTLGGRPNGTGLELARRHQPDLIVLDLELDDVPAAAKTSAGSAGRCKPDYQPRLILLGNLRGRQSDQRPGGEFVAKPYHYGPLIRKIEELLATDTQREFGPCRRCSSSAEPIKAAASS